MRKIASILVVLLFVLALAACYWVPSAGTGEFTVQLSGGARALGGNAARVWLLTEDNVLVPIGDPQDYSEVVISAADAQVTVEKIPAGPRYKILLSLGTVRDGWFQVDRWAESALFEITVGSSVSVPVSLADVPFVYGTPVMGADLRGLVVSGPNLYAVDADTLYTGLTTNGAAGMATAATLPAGHTANSLSIGIAIPGETDVWVNTSKGILPYKGGVDFDVGLTANLGGGTGVSILESGGLIDSGTTEFLFFQRDGGLGGADIGPYYDTLTLLTADTWVDIDVSDFVAGQPVQDFYVDMTSEPEKAYFITKLGAFGATSSLLGQGDNPDLMSLVTFFSVEGGIPILAIEKGASEFVLGTADGVWTTPDPTPPVGTPSITSVAGTRGYSFHKLAATDANWAALSPYYLFIGDGAGVTHTIPFSAGLPGKVSAMVWNNGKLVIAGSEGLVEITP